MKRDFWSGNRPLGHVTLLALSEDFWMTTLYAKGLVKGDGLVAYLWGYGNYKYEIERIIAGARDVPIRRRRWCESFESSYEEAMEKFEKTVDKVVLLWYYNIMIKFLLFLAAAYVAVNVLIFGSMFLIMLWLLVEHPEWAFVNCWIARWPDALSFFGDRQYRLREQR